MRKIGDRVLAHLPRGGLVAGVIAKRERISGYGPRFVLDSGYSIAADDIVNTYGPPTRAEELARMSTRFYGDPAEHMRREIALGIKRAFEYVRVLSIDAWREPDGRWNWNDWHAVGWFPLARIDASPRVVLREMRERGFLSDESRGRVGIEDDGFNVVIATRGNGMPLFAIEYGPALLF